MGSFLQTLFHRRDERIIYIMVQWKHGPKLWHFWKRLHTLSCLWLSCYLFIIIYERNCASCSKHFRWKLVTIVIGIVETWSNFTIGSPQPWISRRPFRQPHSYHLWLHDTGLFRTQHHGRISKSTDTTQPIWRWTFKSWKKTTKETSQIAEICETRKISPHTCVRRKILCLDCDARDLQNRSNP